MKFCCPHCKESIDLPADFEHRPFCSKRFRLLDLGRWLDERFVISGPAAVDVARAWPDATPRHDED